MVTTSFFGEALRHERRLLSADHLILLVAALLLAAIAYGIHNGHARLAKGEQAVAAARAEEQVRLRDNRANLAAMEAGTFKPKSAFTNPANPLWIGNRHAATYAVLPPAALAATSVGQSDLNPPYVKVSADNRDTFAFGDEIENPANLLVGHFDLAFFVVFLLPLLIIALSYNVLSAEREQGTLALLMSNPIRLGAVLLAKLAFRAVLVLGVTLAGTLVFLAVTGAPLATVDGMARLSWWTLLLGAYALFWFALSAAVNAFGRSSAHNVLVLVGLWIVFALVLPTLFSIAVNVAYPVPSRAEMINSVRTVQTDANKEYDATAARFQDEHAAMAADSGVLSAKDFALARKRVLVQQAASQKTDALIARHDEQLLRQQRVVDWLRFLSPAVLMQEALNDVAGTGSSRYRHFTRQVDAFYAEWQAFFVPKVMRNTALTLADYDRFPRFQYAEQPLSSLNARLLPALLGLLLPSLALAWLSARRVRRYPVNG